MHFVTAKWLLAGSSLLLLIACHHDEQPNPCQGMKLKPLTFQILENSDTPTPDTTYNNQLVTFVAPGAPYTSYEWQIGPSTTRTTQQFNLSFDANTLGNIRVRLVAHRPPSTACFPQDTGVDTLTRQLTLVPFKDPYLPERNPRAPIYGKFQGALRSAPRDTFTVRIYQGKNYFYPTDPTAPPTDYVANNLKGCTRPYIDNYLGWYGVYFSGLGCTSFGGHGYVFGRDSLRLSFRTKPAPVPDEANEVFLGKRIR
jgi:hypothetical protein